MELMLQIRGVSKTFVLHNQGGVRLPVLATVDLDVCAGECVAITGSSGAGKSTLLKAIFSNYLVDQGSIRVRHAGQWVDMAKAVPHEVLAVRRSTMGYVSQFLRVIPRVSALDVVAEPLLELGVTASDARLEAATLLSRLNIAERLWTLPPATFSGGEQQRINIARGLVARRPILLLDEPTASLDAKNRYVVSELIIEAKTRGAAVIGIFHDEEVRNRVADRSFAVPPAGRPEADSGLAAALRTQAIGAPAVKQGLGVTRALPPLGLPQ